MATNTVKVSKAQMKKVLDVVARMSDELGRMQMDRENAAYFAAVASGGIIGREQLCEEQKSKSFGEQFTEQETIIGKSSLLVKAGFKLAKKGLLACAVTSFRGLKSLLSVLASGLLKLLLLVLWTLFVSQLSMKYGRMVETIRPILMDTYREGVMEGYRHGLDEKYRRQYVNGEY